MVSLRYRLGRRTVAQVVRWLILSLLSQSHPCHRHAAIKEAGSSEQMALVAQMSPTVEPGLKDGRVRGKTSHQATVVNCHQVCHQHKWVRQHTHCNPHHKLGVASHCWGLAEIVVHGVGVDEVGQEVTTPQKDDLTQDMGHNPHKESPNALIVEDFGDAAEQPPVLDFSPHKLSHASH